MTLFDTEYVFNQLPIEIHKKCLSFVNPMLSRTFNEVVSKRTAALTFIEEIKDCSIFYAKDAHAEWNQLYFFYRTRNKKHSDTIENAEKVIHELYRVLNIDSAAHNISVFEYFNAAVGELPNTLEVSREKYRILLAIQCAYDISPLPASVFEMEPKDYSTLIDTAARIAGILKNYDRVAILVSDNKNLWEMKKNTYYQPGEPFIRPFFRSPDYLQELSARYIQMQQHQQLQAMQAYIRVLGGSSPSKGSLEEKLMNALNQALHMQSIPEQAYQLLVVYFKKKEYLQEKIEIPLFYHAEYGNVKAVKVLLHSKEITKGFIEDMFPVVNHFNHTEVAQALIDKACEIEIEKLKKNALENHKNNVLWKLSISMLEKAIENNQRVIMRSLLHYQEKWLTTESLRFLFVRYVQANNGIGVRLLLEEKGLESLGIILEDQLLTAAFHGGTEVLPVLLAQERALPYDEAIQNPNAFFVLHDEVRLLRLSQTQVEKAFVESAFLGKAESVAIFLKEKGAKKMCLEALKKALRKAIEKNHFEVVNLLAQSIKEKERFFDKKLGEALVLAAMEGDQKIVESIIVQHKNIEISLSDALRLRGLAFEYGWIRVCEELERRCVMITGKQMLALCTIDGRKWADKTNDDLKSMNIMNAGFKSNVKL